MRKREIEEIDRKRAAQIIAMVDEKVTTRYTPLNWAQLIEPWFILMGPELDSELLRQFFQDKELFNLAEHFDEENKLINRTNFIEILSRPDFDIADLENAEEYQKSHPPKHKRVKEEDGEKSSDSDSHPDPKPIQKDPNIRRFQLEQELDSEESDTRLKREGLQNKSAESLQNEQKRPSERKEESYGKKKKELEIPSDEGSSHKDGISKSKKNSSFEDELDRLSKQSTRHATPSEEPFSFDDDNGGDDEDESDSLLDQYSDKGENDKDKNLNELLNFLNKVKNRIIKSNEIKVIKHKENWFSSCSVYCLYVDLFNETFEGLIEKLNYLKTLNIQILWLLPILDSPMKDGGFDIRNYYCIRNCLFQSNVNNNEENKLKMFEKFICEAHRRGIYILMDIALNHTSNENEWFKGACESVNHSFHNYYINVMVVFFMSNFLVYGKKLKEDKVYQKEDWYVCLCVCMYGMFVCMYVKKEERSK
jgi:hypothetical protein